MALAEKATVAEEHAWPSWAAPHAAIIALPDARVDVADSHAAQRAAALLRAHCFTAFPEGRSEGAKNARIRTRAEVEWTAIENKFKGTDVVFRGVPVTPINVSVPYKDNGVGAELDARFARIPEDAGEPERVVVGTLDLNVGALPAEALKPKEAPAPGNNAAFLSNVCVAPSARRQGVAKCVASLRPGLVRCAPSVCPAHRPTSPAPRPSQTRLLVECAASMAAERGLHPLYVHVVATNEPARTLYESMGFAYDGEETETEARKRGKDRRLLLRRDVL